MNRILGSQDSRLRGLLDLARNRQEQLAARRRSLASGPVKGSRVAEGGQRCPSPESSRGWRADAPWLSDCLQQGLGPKMIGLLRDVLARAHRSESATWVAMPSQRHFNVFTTP